MLFKESHPVLQELAPSCPHDTSQKQVCVGWVLDHSLFHRFRVTDDCQGSLGSRHGHCIRALTPPSSSTCQPHYRNQRNAAAARYYPLQCSTTGWCVLGRSSRGALPFSRRFSPRKPTSPSGLLRTRLTMTASFSRPWNPSTLPSSMPGKASLSGARIASFG